MRCAHCRQPINREHSWHRLERGAVANGQTVTADKNFCRPACLAHWLEDQPA